MNNEAWQGILGTLALLPSGLFSLFTWFGGRSENYFGISARIWKRVIAPITFCVLTIGLSILSGHYNVWFWLSVPVYMLTTTVGYGANTFWEKVWKRTVWALIRTAAALTFALFVTANPWILFTLQGIIAVSASVLLGVSGTLAAPQEEGLINFLSVAIVPYLVLI